MAVYLFISISCKFYRNNLYYQHVGSSCAASPYNLRVGEDPLNVKKMGSAEFLLDLPIHPLVIFVP